MDRQMILQKLLDNGMEKEAIDFVIYYRNQDMLLILLILCLVIALSFVINKFFMD